MAAITFRYSEKRLLRHHTTALQEHFRAAVDAGASPPKRKSRANRAADPTPTNKGSDKSSTEKEKDAAPTHAAPVSHAGAGTGKAQAQAQAQAQDQGTAEDYATNPAWLRKGKTDL
jgi:hypothetical protein